MPPQMHLRLFIYPAVTISPARAIPSLMPAASLASTTTAAPADSKTRQIVLFCVGDLLAAREKAPHGARGRIEQYRTDLDHLGILGVTECSGWWDVVHRLQRAVLRRRALRVT